jgi:hypothetical protein
MKLPKPDKLGTAIFIFLIVLSAPAFFGFLPGLKTLSYGEIFGKAYLIYYLFDIFLLFKLFHDLGIPVGGYTGGWWSFPNPNALGSALIILTNIIVYYLLAIFLASRIKNEKNKTIATHLVRALTVLFILLFTASALPATIMQNRMARCSNQCLPPAEQSYSACCDNCHASFPEWDKQPTNAMPPAYQTCMDACFQVREARIKECNASCLKK